MDPAQARRPDEDPAETDQEVAPQALEADEVDEVTEDDQTVVPLADGVELELEPEPITLDVERLASLLLGKGEPTKDPDDEVAEAGPSLHGYHEWQLQRLQRKLRMVTWAFVAFVTAMAVYVAATSGLFTSTPTDGREAAAQVAAEVDGLESDLQDLTEAQAATQDTLESISSSLEETQGSVDGFDASIAQIDRNARDLARCMNRAISTFDKDLRALIQRNTTPGAFVRRPAPATCKP